METTNAVSFEVSFARTKEDHSSSSSSSSDDDDEAMCQISEVKSHLNMSLITPEDAMERADWRASADIQGKWIEKALEAGCSFEPFGEEDMSNEPFGGIKRTDASAAGAARGSTPLTSTSGMDAENMFSSIGTLSKALGMRSDHLMQEIMLGPCGQLTYPVGNPMHRKRYAGQFDPKVPQPHGIGVMEWDRAGEEVGPTCEGQWVHNKLEGYCVYKWPGGNHYEGQFLEGHKHGTGMMTIVDEKGAYVSSYTGDWETDEAHGQGIYKNANGDMYTGDFVLNMKQGEGRLKYANGSRYEGDWLQDCRNGQGVMMTSEGDVYDGGWLNDQFHGFGTLKCKDGHIYEGMHKEGVWDGVGTLTYPPVKGRCKKLKGTWLTGILRTIKEVSEIDAPRMSSTSLSTSSSTDADGAAEKDMLCSKEDDVISIQMEAMGVGVVKETSGEVTDADAALRSSGSHMQAVT